MRVAAYAFILAAAILMIAVMLGYPLFGPEFDESRRGEVLGCYFIDDAQVMEVTLDTLRLSSGEVRSYRIWTDKTGFALLPSSRLRLSRANDGRWQLASVRGSADLLRFRGRNLDSVELDTIDRQVFVASRRPCV